MNNVKKLVIVIILELLIMNFPIIFVDVFGIEFNGFIQSSFLIQMGLLIAALVYMKINKVGLHDFGFAANRLRYYFSGFAFGTLSALFGFIFMIMFVMIGGVTEGSPHPANANGFLSMVFHVWIIASFCEEVFFRGFVYNYFSHLKEKGFRIGKKLFISVPVTISAILFGLTHLILLKSMAPQMVYGIVCSTMLLGFVAGVIREKSGSLFPAYVAHLMANVVGYIIPTLLKGMQ